MDEINRRMTRKRTQLSREHSRSCASTFLARRAARWLVLLMVFSSAVAAQAENIRVVNNSDGPEPGPNGSLRRAISAATAGDTIDFTPSITTITLTSGELLINKNLTITGPG